MLASLTKDTCRAGGINLHYQNISQPDYPSLMVEGGIGKRALGSRRLAYA